MLFSLAYQKAGRLSTIWGTCSDLSEQRIPQRSPPTGHEQDAGVSSLVKGTPALKLQLSPMATATFL